MESGDVLTIAVAIAIVVVIAIVANPQYLSAVRPPAPSPAQTPVPESSSPTPVPPLTLPATIAPASPASPAIPALPVPERIFYADNPLSYPVFTMPDIVFGASDIPLRNADLVTFAYVEETRGGLTRTFTVPYPVWVVNTTVIANISPQYGNFRMVICYASNGTVIKGQEVLNRGTAYTTVEVSGVPMYMIVSTTSIDQYRIELQTPRSYYEAGKREVAVLTKIIEMTNQTSSFSPVINNALKQGDYPALGAGASSLRSYIDASLPDLQRLAKDAGNEKAAADESIVYFEDLRTGADLTAQAADRYDAGDRAGSALLLDNAKKSFDNATRDSATVASLLSVHS